MVGLVFDFYRSFRRWQDWGWVLTFVGDVCFSLVALIILFYFFERANALAFRFYIIWGSLLGLILYLKLLSFFFMRFFFRLYRLITYVFGLFRRGIKIPLRGIVILMRPPYAILRWLGLLAFRMGEYILVKPLLQIVTGIKAWWNSLLPPKTNG